MGNDNIEVKIIKEFTECPWCGSREVMMGKLGEEMKEKGLIGPDMNVGLDEIGGTIIDPRLAGKMLARSIRPGMFALRDICLGCGRSITTRIEKKPVEVGLGPMPNVGGEPLPGPRGGLS